MGNRQRKIAKYNETKLIHNVVGRRSLAQQQQHKQQTTVAAKEQTTTRYTERMNVLNG